MTPGAAIKAVGGQDPTAPMIAWHTIQNAPSRSAQCVVSLSSLHTHQSDANDPVGTVFRFGAPLPRPKRSSSLSTPCVCYACTAFGRSKPTLSSPRLESLWRNEEAARRAAVRSSQFASEVRDCLPRQVRTQQAAAPRAAKHRPESPQCAQPLFPRLPFRRRRRAKEMGVVPAHIIGSPIDCVTTSSGPTDSAQEAALRYYTLRRNAEEAPRLRRRPPPRRRRLRCLFTPRRTASQ